MNTRFKYSLLAALIAPVWLTACGGSDSNDEGTEQQQAEHDHDHDHDDHDHADFNEADIDTVVSNYGQIAYAIITDSLTTAQALKVSLETLVADPTEANLTVAKNAWLTARVPYQQSEAYRFGHALFDDWEGQLNAWPLDEGLIDYVDGSYIGAEDNLGANANVIAGTTDLTAQGVDVTVVDADLVLGLNELYGEESNVASGYHAIEFLLWGQDLNGHDAGAGTRPATDYATDGTCTNGNCDRRGDYLIATVDILIADLQEMQANWTPNVTDNYRAEFEALEHSTQLGVMLEGMGELAAGELAGERMKTALTQNSTEDEHDCFSDNTHNSHYYDMISIENILLGQYNSPVDAANSVNADQSAPSFMSLLTSVTDTATLTTELANAKAVVTAIKTLAESGTAFDQMIAPGEANAANRQVVQDAIDALEVFTTALENASTEAQIARTAYPTAE